MKSGRTSIEIRAGGSRLAPLLGEVWQYRELFFFLVWRDVLVRYKQTALGILWAVARPLVSMVIFTVIFGRWGGFDAKTGLDPKFYPIFVYTALLPWFYFSGALTASSESLVGSAGIITKVYFPRIIIPAAAALSGLVDFFFSFIVMMGIMAWFGIPPAVEMLALPLLLMLTFLLAAGFGLFLSAVMVRFRDVRFIVPFAVQIWMFLSPVIYPSEIFPEKYRPFLAINPMTGVIEAFRWSFLGYPREFPAPELAISVAFAVAALAFGLWYFKRVERAFADVI
jgi:lipopolysaccharide transport system permease protein